MKIIHLKDKTSGREEHDDLEMLGRLLTTVPSGDSVTIDEMERCLNTAKKLRATGADPSSPLFRKLILEDDEWEFLKRRVNGMKWITIHADIVACRNNIRDAATITPEQIKEL